MNADFEAVSAAAHQGDPVALTRALVAEPSVNPELEEGGQGEQGVATLCAGWLGGWGFTTDTVEVAPGRFNVVGTLGSGAPRLLLNGHLDTVGVEGMEIEPFDPAMDNGRILGRGSCDMKGGVGALLAAAAAVARAGGPPRGTLVVALTADEEHASLGMQAFVESDPGADGAIVCEPTGLAVMPCHKGFIWLDAVFHGRAAHGSRPGLGVDAVRRAGLFLAELEAVHAEVGAIRPHPVLGRPSFHIGTIRGGTAPSVYPAECRITLERRTLPGESLEEALTPFQQALQRARQELNGGHGELSVGLVRPGTEVAEDAPIVRELEAALADEGIPPRVEGMTAWVDAAFLNEAGIPAICFGPGDIGLAHAADEWVSVDEVRTAAAVLERFVGRFLRH
jgi:acetylornithine deacetylase